MNKQILTTIWFMFGLAEEAATANNVHDNVCVYSIQPHYNLSVTSHTVVNESIIVKQIKTNMIASSHYKSSYTFRH